MSNNNQIPTALEFLHRDESGIFNEVDITQAMIEFAKLHVEVALRAASKKAKIKYEYEGNTGSEYYSQYVDSSSILNAYPLNNIQ